VRIWKDRRKNLQFPLFPGYLFIRGGLEHRARVLNSPGVCKLIAWSGKAAVISEEEIATVRALVDGPLPVEPHEYVCSGQKVRSVEGALEGVQGILVRKKNSTRVVVSVGLLGRSAAVDIGLHAIEVIGGTFATPRLPRNGAGRNAETV